MCMRVWKDSFHTRKFLVMDNQLHKLGSNEWIYESCTQTQKILRKLREPSFLRDFYYTVTLNIRT